MNITTLTPHQLEQLGDYGKRRAAIVSKLEHLRRNRAKVEHANVSFNFESERDFKDHSRGTEALAERLMVATIDHFEQELAWVNAQLKKLGVEITG